MRTHFAKRSLGQNFLVDRNYIQKIVDAVEPSEFDLIIEIGPGRGALTEKLLASGASVLAVELDDDLVGPLTERFGVNDKFLLLHQDALTIDFKTAVTEHLSSNPSLRSVKLAANLPYYISTAILERLSEQREVFAQLVLMFQREVVDRITAKPGSSERGFLTVLIQLAFEVEKLFDVPPNAFRPVPKVTSSVVKLTPKPRLAVDEKEFRKLLSIAFAQKRKTILNNLKINFPNAHECLERSSIDPKRRAESLELDEWLRIFDILK